MAGRNKLIALTNIIFWVGVAYASVAYVLPKWRDAQLSERLALLPVPYLAVAVALIGCQYLAIFLLWRMILRLLGASAGSWPTFYAYALSLLPRYVPGKVLGQGMRLRLALVAGIPARLVVASLAWETVLGFASAVTIVALGLALGAAGDLVGAARWVLVSFVAIAVLGTLLLRLLGEGRWQGWLGTVEFARRPGTVVALLGLYLATWLLVVMAHWALAHAIAPPPTAQLFPLLVALCVSWGVGTLSFMAPAGLGVREGVLFLFVQNWMGAGEALLFVTLSRLSAFVVEVALTVVAWTLAIPSSRSREASM